MQNMLIVISSAISIGSSVPYIIDIIKHKTKPRVVSWFTWGILGFIAGFASLSDHQYPAAVFSLVGGVLCGVIFVLGLYHDGEKSFSLFDAVCQIIAVIGLLLWYIFDSPSIAIAASIGVDLVASLPTLKHAWQKPFEETWITFCTYVVASMFTILAVTDYKVTSVANPIYILSINLLITSILLTRRRAVTKSA